ncbi:hypothetical protein J1N35_001511 [Gossypium stocksii]|uniref:Aminotransferase-like plant mobile domain-containing protein n=1 Tax=Gossypium stocksii TaxID=47602 RepID=A0A9D3WK28_9ROSI|nr:hypothetical protein J1N35_001511 [Gossypium stocksii]
MATLIRTFELRPDLVSTLVERWHPETHTFHLPCGECIIILEAVALQLELPVDKAIVKGLSKGEIFVVYRQMIEACIGEVFVWMTYIATHAASVTPRSAYHHSYVWCIKAPIINFSTIEWYNSDRVLRKFDGTQDVPDFLFNLNHVHDINKKEKYAKNWALKHQR